MIFFDENEQKRRSFENTLARTNDIVSLSMIDFDENEPKIGPNFAHSTFCISSHLFLLAHYHSTMPGASEIVKFNVGGRHFEISRTLINGNSETVLGKLASDTWNDDPGKAVFIGRDGDIFAHILNYLRYGR